MPPEISITSLCFGKCQTRSCKDVTMKRVWQGQQKLLKRKRLQFISYCCCKISLLQRKTSWWHVYCKISLLQRNTSWWHVFSQWKRSLRHRHKVPHDSFCAKSLTSDPTPQYGKNIELPEVMRPPEEAQMQTRSLWCTERGAAARTAAILMNR